GANTWMSGGISMPPGIGFGSEPAAEAVPGSNIDMATATATRNETENRALIGLPLPLGRPEALENLRSLRRTRSPVKFRVRPSRGETPQDRNAQVMNDSVRVEILL